ncbi:hypothetical protein L1987_68084 [Smallanthus sonchifolius]|uniref:Uncharacterized protein n=1 Tax=Smallanthus sonchifolius TaxID=185202 RepID=A0ACB9B4P7_9ASTR|nr:hypothetical protein L1987_68084 [Smallanthus sonchifolius]
MDTTTTASNSPEFEFWITRNPSSQQSTLHSADELFSDGVLLPLCLLHIDDPPDIQPESTNPPESDNIAGSDLKKTLTASKRWKDIFKKNPQSKDAEKKKKKISGAGAGAGVGTGTAELNINLWPFSRSRSAGNIGSRPRTVVGNRKVSSAPCSRSNSTGDKYRKWPSSPGRAGVHLGRSSPVWQAKRFGQSRSLHDGLVRNGNTVEKVSRPAKSSTTGAGAGSVAGVSGKVLNLNVPTCIGYRQRMSCQSDVSKENHRTGCVAGGDGGVTPVSAGGEGGASGLFNLKSLFTKKVF